MRLFILAEFIGEGLEADPTRGVRIKKEAFAAVAGVPRSSEYESVLEQDPFGDTHETGGNDDIWGEWGLGMCACAHECKCRACAFREELSLSLRARTHPSSRDGYPGPGFGFRVSGLGRRVQV